ncbi:MAG: hypothetical protein CEN88_250, partial [Candidatus Berkelbacteria bacterium Licking1014_2]
VKVPKKAKNTAAKPKIIFGAGIFISRNKTKIVQIEKAKADN